MQFLFVAFGATVLVPLLVGLDPATALFTAGLGVYLPFRYRRQGSHLPRVQLRLHSTHHKASVFGGMPDHGGYGGVALVYFLMSLLIMFQGRRVLDKLFFRPL